MTNLQKYRISCGLSQSQLAEKVGISVRVLQNYEQEVRNLDKAAARTVLKIARAVGKTVEDLI